jgi:hypothetical protein
MSSVQVSLVRVPAKGFAGLLPLALGEADENYIEDTWTITATGNEESTTFVCPPAEFGRFAWRIVIDGEDGRHWHNFLCQLDDPDNPLLLRFQPILKLVT